MQHSKLSPIQLALAAISTALVCIATIIFSVYVPQTRGFFNIGETMVYTTALLFGPFIGAFAGGVGSMLADLFLGYPHYAPATLLIKACEGGVVGLLSRRKPQLESKFQWKVFTFSVGLIAGFLLGGVGALFYSGSFELKLGYPPPENPNVVFFVPPAFWFVLGAVVVFLITLTGFVFEPEFGWMLFSTLAGGAIMVTGYFLYQSFLLFPLFGIEVVAIAEIPFNVGQMLIGLTVAIPVVRIISHSFPQIKI